jgi:hypothetical protein
MSKAAVTRVTHSCHLIEMVPSSCPARSISVFTAVPETDSYDKLQLLSVIGTQQH